jgi:hypothetical protein
VGWAGSHRSWSGPSTPNRYPLGTVMMRGPPCRRTPRMDSAPLQPRSVDRHQRARRGVASPRLGRRATGRHRDRPGQALAPRRCCGPRSRCGVLSPGPPRVKRDMPVRATRRRRHRRDDVRLRNLDRRGFVARIVSIRCLEQCWRDRWVRLSVLCGPNFARARSC